MAAFQVFCSLIIYISFNFVVSTDYIGNVTTPINGSFFLYPGDGIWSRSKQSVFRFQVDGNLVLYVNNDAIFSSKTANQNAKEFEITSSGNMVMMNTSDNIIWTPFASSQSIKTQPFCLSVLKKCVFLTNNQYDVFWSRGNKYCNCDPSFMAQNTDDPTAPLTPSPTPMYQNYVTIPINASFILHSSSRILSKSMDTELVMQPDGNLVLYHYDACFRKGLWNTETSTTMIDAPYMEVYSNGNIELKDKNDKVYWKSDTTGNIAMQPFRLGVALDCVYLMDSNLNIFWEQGTGCNTFVIPQPTSAPSHAPSHAPFSFTPTLSTFSTSESPLAVSPTSDPFQSTLHPTQFPSKYLTAAPANDPSTITQTQTRAPLTSAPSALLFENTIWKNSESIIENTNEPKQQKSDKANDIWSADWSLSNTILTIVAILSSIAIAIVVYQFVVKKCLEKYVEDAKNRRNMFIGNQVNHIAVEREKDGKIMKQEEEKEDDSIEELYVKDDAPHDDHDHTKTTKQGEEEEEEELYHDEGVIKIQDVTTGNNAINVHLVMYGSAIVTAGKPQQKVVKEDCENDSVESDDLWENPSVNAHTTN